MAPPDLKISQLRAFAAVADAGGFVRAARRLAVAQPVVSRRVKMLEAQLNVRLLERSPSRKPAALIAAGRALLPHARALLDRHDRVVALAAAPLRPSVTSDGCFERTPGTRRAQQGGEDP